ncbi:hypothetical protein [Amycolatopsis pigmentata]|uniref:PE family protein n=1 Tax=Amycolatopsis pigmentata TaxID=450801 RepID=A0ABW5FQZ9_9PSEU
MAIPSLPAGVRAVAVTDAHWPGRTTVSVAAPHPSAQAQAMVTALQETATGLHNAYQEGTVPIVTNPTTGTAEPVL